MATAVGLVPAARTDEARVGVGVGPVRSGRASRSAKRTTRGRTAVIKRKDEPGERTTMIRKEEHVEPESKVIIYERDHD